MGAERIGVPICIDYNQAMKRAGGETCHLEIINRKGSLDQSPEQDEENDIAYYTDDELQQNIQRYHRHLKTLGPRLKDNGENVKRMLTKLYNELERRTQEDDQSKTCADTQNGEQLCSKGEKLTCNGSIGESPTSLPFRGLTTKQTGQGHEESDSCAFDEELGNLKGVMDTVNRDVRLAGKSKSNNGYQGSDNTCTSSKTVPPAAFYRERRLSQEFKKKQGEAKHHTEAEDSIPSRVASGKRNRTTSPLDYSLNEELSTPRPLLCREATKPAIEGSASVQKSRLLSGVERHRNSSVSVQKNRFVSGMERHRGRVGASLDTAMELSDDEEQRGREDAQDTSLYGTSTSVNQNALRTNSGRVEDFRITYPSGDPEAVEVQQSDLKHLDLYEFLNDTIIDFYIKYLQRPENLTKEKKARFHFFNTFFYKKLLLEKKKRKNFDCYSKLRKWTKGINIFEKKYLLVPVHDCAHWSLAIICFCTEQRQGMLLRPYILHLDSMKEGHASKEVFDLLKSYLMVEWNHNQSINVDRGSCCMAKDILGERVEVPLQQNAWDCGLFLLYFIQCFLRDAHDEIKPSLLNSMFGRKWFKPQEASNLRRHIKLLIDNLVENENGEILMEDMD